MSVWYNIFFYKVFFSFCGVRYDILCFCYVWVFDYEVEFGLVIGWLVIVLFDVSE